MSKKLDTAKLALIGLIQNMPYKSNDEIVMAVRIIVDEGDLRRSAPPSENNYPIIAALQTINHQMNLTIREEAQAKGVDVLPF